jgi:hypothetical protein
MGHHYTQDTVVDIGQGRCFTQECFSSGAYLGRVRSRGDVYILDSDLSKMFTRGSCSKG